MRQRGHAAAERLSNIRIVLVRPLGSANVGAAARAMKNMGLSQLTMVRPAVRRFAAAAAMAVHARDVLRNAPKVATLGAAVADCALVVGTTCRGGQYRAYAEPAQAIAPIMLEAARHGPVAVLFGPEDHGLTNDDLRVCQRLISIDTDPAYASLNLAQAVVLVCYELRRAAQSSHPANLALAPVPAADLQRMYDHLQRALLSIGFLHPQNPEHIMFALRALFGRTGLAEHEVRILLGIARQIEWAAGQMVRGRQSSVASRRAVGPTADDRRPTTDDPAPRKAYRSHSDRPAPAARVPRNVHHG
jgi:TrmH family RNA methyltransferase